MMWISKNWDEHYANRAKKIIKELVTSLLSLQHSLLINDLQMVEYRARSPTEASASSSRQEQSYAFDLDNLASQYGISDMMTSNDDDQPPQTIDEEYNAYISAPCSKGINSLKFWEVCVRYANQVVMTEFGMILAQRNQVSHLLRYNARLPADPGFCRSLRACVLLKCRD